jgi:hypothetical protein
MSSKAVNHPKIERWSLNRKVELVLKIVKGHTDAKRTKVVAGNKR